jgi:predicted HAD superfamily hydrolase
LRKWLAEQPGDTLHSFDIFDTLVTRLWRRPADLFLVLGADLARRGVIKMAARDFAAARDAAELDARQGQASGEVSLEEIHEHLARRAAIDAGVAATILDAELALEIASARPIAATVGLIGEAVAGGRAVALTSDTYFSSAAISGILTSAGVDPGNFQMFLSSERRASKRRGDLYRLLRDGHRHGPIAHVGDKQWTDVDNARGAGLRAHVFSQQEPTRREDLLGRGWADAILASAASGSARAARLRGVPSDIRKATIRSAGAGVAGPLLSTYVAWVLESAAARGIDRLLFLARDGQVLHRIAQKLAPAMGIDIACRYTYASRQALYLPAVRAVGDGPWTWLSAKMEGRTVGQVLARFGVDGAEDLSGFQSDEQERVVDAELAESITERLATGAVAERVLAEAGRRRELARQYFDKELGDCRKGAIVDLGWKGRLQVCLEQILDGAPGAESRSVDGYYFAREGAAIPPRRGQAFAFTPFRTLPNPVLVECFAPADHGTLLGLQRSASGEAEPMLAPFDVGAAPDIRELQDAVLDFTDNFIAASQLCDGDVAGAFAALKGPALSVFADFVRSPSGAEAEVFGDIEHADDQAHHGASRIAAPLGRSDLLWLAGMGAHRSGRRLSYWPEASLRRSQPPGGVQAIAINALARWRRIGDAGIALLRAKRRALASRPRRPDEAHR